MAPWVELTIAAPPDLSEALASYLFDLGSVGLESVEEADVAVLKAFFQDFPPTEDLRTFCRDAARRIQHSWEPEIQIRVIVQEDWAENWKLHFQSIRIGRQLCISPPWDTETEAELIRIVIHPGMAFGTGQHPTTKGCLELIEAAIDAAPPQGVLDVGTGSGILAIAACKLGAGEVHAIDTDPVACRIALENAAANGCSSRLQVTSSWTSLKDGPFDMVIANLSTNLLCDLAPDLARRVCIGGAFICSGFLTADEHTVRNSYPDFSPHLRRQEGGWTTLLMRRP
jgi:ribosomal protein L11 methyltransferase